MIHCKSREPPSILSSDVGPYRLNFLFIQGYECEDWFLENRIWQIEDIVVVVLGVAVEAAIVGTLNQGPGHFKGNAPYYLTR